MAPNRIAVYVTAVAALLGALAPAVANLDLTSTVGVIGGLATLLAVVRKWLDGWQAHEHRQAARVQRPPGTVLAYPPSTSGAAWVPVPPATTTSGSDVTITGGEWSGNTGTGAVLVDPLDEKIAADEGVTALKPHNPADIPPDTGDAHAARKVA